jgi:hypothetical protein
MIFRWTFHNQSSVSIELQSLFGAVDFFPTADNTFFQMLVGRVMASLEQQTGAQQHEYTEPTAGGIVNSGLYVSVLRRVQLSPGTRPEFDESCWYFGQALCIRPRLAVCTA